MAAVLGQLKAALLNPVYGWKTTHFWGPIANWGIVLAGVYDMTTKGPEVISLPMTSTLCVYSALFMRFAWMVQPRNYLLLSCHVFNEGVQLTQMYRRLKYDRELEQRTERVATTSRPVAAFCTAAATAGWFVPKLQKRVTSLPMPTTVRSFLQHPAGPFTIFFWAPAGKWGLSGANIMDYKRPVEQLSMPQQVALALTGLIWTRYSFVIIPKNYSLALVNFALGCTGGYHVFRKTVYDPFGPEKTIPTIDTTKLAA